MAATVESRNMELESQAIRAESARWLQAVETRDVGRVAGFYANDGAFLVPNAPLARGRDAVRAVWGQLLGAPNLSLDWAPSSVEVAQAGDLACEIGAYQLGMDGPTGRIEDDGKYVVVWRKNGRGWEVAADIFNSNRPLPSPDAAATTLATQLVAFLETGDVPAGLFTADVFCDFTLPKWRLQSEGIDGLVRLRKQGHPGPGTVPRWRCDPTPTGFVMEFEERWAQDGKDWYSRELARADVTNGSISSLSVYCTGDWDAEHRAKHAREVELIRR